jgi:hypothetical protein
MPDLTPEQMQQLVENAIQSPTIPKIYMNGFNIGQSASDIFLVMHLMDKPLGIIHMSFTTAKTLVQSLGQALSVVEAKTKQPIPLMDEVRGTGEEVAEV